MNHLLAGARARSPLLLAVALALLGAALHTLCVPDGLRERSDLAHYLESAGRWAIDGAAPYREFPFEYPPAALLLLRAPVALVAAGLCHFETALELTLLPFDALALFAAFCLAWRAPSAPSLRHGLGALAFAWLGLLFCGSLLFTRFDLAPSALLALAAVLASQAPGAAGAALGAAAAIKVYPLWTAPALAARLWRERADGKQVGVAKVGIATGSAVAAALVLSLPAALAGGSAVLSFLGYQGDRGVQVQSLWGSLWLLLGQRGWVPAAVEHAFGAEQLRGAPAWLGALAAALPLLWMALCAAVARGLPLRCAALAALCGFVALGKVGSPQFSIALAPLAAGCLFDAPFEAVAVLASIALGAWQFPFHYQELLEGRGVWPALGALRMALVLGAGISLLRKPSARAAPR